MKSTKNLPLQVDRVDSPSIEEFTRFYAKPGKPILITGIISAWRACSLCNPQYFKLLVAESSVPVKRMCNGNYLDARIEMMKLADYLDSIDNPIGNEQIYLSQQLVGQILPEIVGDYTVPPYIDSSKFRSVCYLGGYMHSQIHFHRMDLLPTLNAKSKGRYENPWLKRKH